MDPDSCSKPSYAEKKNPKDLMLSCVGKEKMLDKGLAEVLEFAGFLRNKMSCAVAKQFSTHCNLDMMWNDVKPWASSGWEL